MSEISHLSHVVAEHEHERRWLELAGLDLRQVELDCDVLSEPTDSCRCSPTPPSYYIPRRRDSTRTSEYKDYLFTPVQSACSIAAKRKYALWKSRDYCNVCLCFRTNNRLRFGASLSAFVGSCCRSLCLPEKVCTSRARSAFVAAFLFTITFPRKPLRYIRYISPTVLFILQKEYPLM